MLAIDGRGPREQHLVFGMANATLAHDQEIPNIFDHGTSARKRLSGALGGYMHHGTLLLD